MNEEEILKQLNDIEWYGPTIPLQWQKYHSMIRELVGELKAEKKKVIDLTSKIRKIRFESNKKRQYDLDCLPYHEEDRRDG